jgi:FMN phosphatase YigB (HAD superfamily)
MNVCFVICDSVDSSFTVTYRGRVFDVRPILVLDFDGTVCTGDGPVWGYADAAFAQLGDAGDPDIAELRDRFARFLAGDATVPRYPDGYAAVAALVVGRLTAYQLDGAYLASRQELANGADLTTPGGLPEMLAKLGGRVERLLVTNAPLAGIRETLARLGLDDVIDDIHPNAGKPTGFHRLLDRLLTDRDPGYVLSVGDFYANDIAIPLARGCVTAFIDRFDQRTGPAHLHGATFDQLYDDILAWADDPAGFAASYQPIDNTTEEPV